MATPHDRDFITNSLADGTLSEVRFESDPEASTAVVTVRKGEAVKSLRVQRLHLTVFGYPMLADTVRELAGQLSSNLRSDDADPEA